VQVATFDMVEDFWGIFNNIRPPSRLNPGSNYHLFKIGIEPTWEHTANMAGGKWNYGCVCPPASPLLILPPARCAFASEHVRPAALLLLLDPAVVHTYNIDCEGHGGWGCRALGSAEC